MDVKSIISTKVVIVGAGPTGLTMAACLMQLDIDFVILDKKFGPTKESKAMVVHARSLEIFDSLGLSDKFISEGEVSEKMNFVVKGKINNTINIKKFGTGQSKFPFVLTLEQSKTEQILVDHIHKQGGIINWNSEFVDIKSESDAEVLIQYRKDDKIHQVQSTYVIACDGATSPIRKRLEIPFNGSTESNLFYVADVKMVSDHFHKKELYISFLRQGFALIFGMEGQDHFRIIGLVPEDFDKRENLEFADFSHYIEDQLGSRVKFHDTYWFSTYRVHSRIAELFQVGNIFLAGDACHIHTPAGGQGMNTGIQDAYNLAWKLARVMNGKSSEKLLKTYHKERYANAVNLLKTTDRTFEFMVSDSALPNFFKRFVFPTMTKLISNTSLGSHLFFPTVSQLGITYKERSLSNFFKFGKVLAGDRMPYSDNEKFDSYSLSHTMSDNYRLLYLSTTAAEVKKAIDNLQIECTQIDAFPKSLGFSTVKYVLLRPDNHIAYLGSDLEMVRKVITTVSS